MNYTLKSTRDAYGEALLELGRKNKDIVALTGDLTESTRASKFRDEFPDRFFNIGIAEQNMMGIAAGLSFTGKIPFVSTFSIFALGRAWEQVRLSICYADANVKIIGTHSGFSDGADGASHQMLEDIALARVIPNMKVIVPCDFNEAKKAVHAAAKIKGPVYIRLSRDESPVITPEDNSGTGKFEIGKANIMKDGNDISIIACGKMIYSAICAAEKLEKEGIKARVINMHTIKPIDEQAIINAVKETKAIVTAEEHQTTGGMGSAVLEAIAKLSKKIIPVAMVGVDDKFGMSGKVNELMEYYKLTKEEIVRKAHLVLEK